DVNSTWSIPRHLVSTDSWSSIVFGSRKSRRCRRSATMIADRPSGEKYMLYGSSTSIGLPFAPVTGSTGVSWVSSLLSTHNVDKSYDGTTCCGTRPARNVRTIVCEAGSITVTDAERELGT